MGLAMREKFTIEIKADVLADLRAIAQAEGRQLQTLVEEALADLIEKRRSGPPRAHVMAAYRTSLDHFAPLYEKLAR